MVNKMGEEMMKYKVLEDGYGCLHLAVFNDKNNSDMCTRFYMDWHIVRIRERVSDIKNGVNIEYVQGTEVPPILAYIYVTHGYHAKVIEDQDGVYPENMSDKVKKEYGL